MEVAYHLPTPYITTASKYPEEFLTIKEFGEAAESGFIKTKTLNTYKKNRCRLSLYLGDDPKNLSRPIYVGFKGYSKYGISKFKKQDEDTKKEETEEVPEVKDAKKTKQEQRKKLGSWSIAFSLEENPNMVTFCDIVDAKVKEFLAPLKAKIYDYFGVNVTETPLTYRKSGRATTGSSNKMLRLTVLPGRCELGPRDDYNVFESLSTFETGPGIYDGVLHVDHIDISFEKEVVSVGAIIYAVMIRKNPTPKVSLKRKIRDEEPETTSTDSLSEKDGTAEVNKDPNNST